MSSPVLIGGLVVGGLALAGSGVGAWWYFKADRIVDEGETSGWKWRISRDDGLYIPEVQPPPIPGFAAFPWTRVGTTAWEERLQAKAIALNHIAIQLLPAPPGAPPAPPTGIPEITPAPPGLEVGVPAAGAEAPGTSVIAAQAIPVIEATYIPTPVDWVSTGGR